MCTYQHGRHAGVWRAVTMAAVLAFVLVAGCSRDSTSGDGSSSSGDSSAFRNLGKR